MARKSYRNTEKTSKDITGRRNYVRSIDEKEYGGVRRRKVDTISNTTIKKVTKKRPVLNKNTKKTWVGTNKVKSRKTQNTAIVESNSSASDKKISLGIPFWNKNKKIHNQTNDCADCMREDNCCNTTYRIRRLENVFWFFTILITIITTAATSRFISNFKQEIFEKILQKQIESKNEIIQNEQSHEKDKTVSSAQETKTSTIHEDNKPTKEEKTEISNNVESTPYKYLNITDFNPACAQITVINQYYTINDCITSQTDFSKKTETLLVPEVTEQNDSMNISTQNNEILDINGLSIDVSKIDGIIIGSCESFQQLFDGIAKGKTKASSSESFTFSSYGSQSMQSIPPLAPRREYGSAALAISYSYSGGGCCVPSVGPTMIGVAGFMCISCQRCR